MSAARKIQRRTARDQQVGGAFNLDHLKGGDVERQQMAANDSMMGAGFLCGCGQRIRDEGIVAMGYNLGRFPSQVMTPKGPQMVIDDGVQFMQMRFCSRQCTDFLDALKNGINHGMEGVIRPSILALGHMSPVEWLDEKKVEIA